MITFESGLRCFIDCLEGNVHFRIGGQDHNLFGALVQCNSARAGALNCRKWRYLMSSSEFSDKLELSAFRTRQSA